MIKYTQFVLKMGTGYFFQAISLILLGCFLVSASVADTVPIKEIGFAKVSGMVGGSKKTAGCLIVWPADGSGEDVFCRYQFGKKRFLRDDDTGNITPPQAFLATNKTFPKKIADWLKNRKYQLSIKGSSGKQIKTVGQTIADFISQTDFPSGKFHGKETKTYVLELGKLADNVDDNKFAFFVHGAIRYHLALQQNVEKFITTFDGSDEAKSALKSAFEKPEVMNFLQTPSAVEVLQKEHVTNFLSSDNANNILATLTKSSEAMELLQKEEVVKALNTTGVPELLTHSEHHIVRQALVAKNAEVVTLLQNPQVISLLKNSKVQELFTDATKADIRTLLQNQETIKLLQNPDVVKVLAINGIQKLLVRNNAQNTAGLEVLKNEKARKLLTPEVVRALNIQGVPELLMGTSNPDVLAVLNNSETRILLQKPEVVGVLNTPGIEKLLPPEDQNIVALNTLISNPSLLEKVLESEVIRELLKTEGAVEKLASYEAIAGQFKTPLYLQSALLAISILLIIVILAVVLWLSLTKVKALEGHFGKEGEITKELSTVISKTDVQNQKLQQLTSIVEKVQPSLEKLLHSQVTTFSEQVGQLMKSGRGKPQIPEQSSEHDETQKKLKEAVTEQSHLRDESHKDKQSLTDAQTELSALKKRYDASTQELTDTKTELSKLKKQHEQHEAVTTELTATKTELSELKKQHEATTTELTGTTVELSALKEQHEATTTELSGLKEQHDVVKQELQGTTGKLTTLQGQHTEAQKQNRQLAHDLTTCQKNYNNVENALNEDKKALQNVLVTCFHLPQPDTLNLSEWATGVITRKGTWPWLRQVLSGELFACQQVVDNLKDTGSEEDQKILQLLEMDDILSGWNTLLSGLEFDSDDELWSQVRTIDSGRWLNRVLRANDLLQTYFSDKQPFSLLSSHLASAAGELNSMLLERGMQLLKPQLFEKVPDYIPNKPTHRRKEPNSLLVELVKEQVRKKLDTMPEFVVDIETYGFVTADNPKADVRVIVTNPVEWN